MFSEFSAFSAFLFFTLYALICCILCRKVGWHTLRAFGIGIGLLILRCLLPFEIPGVELIKIGGWYADFYLWLNPPLAEGITPLAMLIITWVVGSILLWLRLDFAYIGSAMKYGNTLLTPATVSSKSIAIHFKK